MNRVVARRFAGFLAVMGIGSVFAIASSARAEAIASTAPTYPDVQSTYYYSYGSVGNGSGGYDFQGTAGYLLAPGSFSLGEFSINGFPQGSSLTLANIPFTIDLMVYSSGSNGQFGGADVILINGALNGTVSGDDSSTVIATLTSVQDLGLAALPFSLSDLHLGLPQLLAPGGINGGTTTLTGQFSAAFYPVPEPATLVVFGAVAAWIGLRQRNRRRVA